MCYWKLIIYVLAEILFGKQYFVAEKKHIKMRIVGSSVFERDGVGIAAKCAEISWLCVEDKLKKLLEFWNGNNKKI